MNKQNIKMIVLLLICIPICILLIIGGIFMIEINETFISIFLQWTLIALGVIGIAISFSILIAIIMGIVYFITNKNTIDQCMYVKGTKDDILKMVLSIIVCCIFLRPCITAYQESEIDLIVGASFFILIAGIIFLKNDIDFVITTYRNIKGFPLLFTHWTNESRKKLIYTSIYKNESTEEKKLARKMDFNSIVYKFILLLITSCVLGLCICIIYWNNEFIENKILIHILNVLGYGGSVICGIGIIFIFLQILGVINDDYV